MSAMITPEEANKLSEENDNLREALLQLYIHRRHVDTDDWRHAVTLAEVTLQNIGLVGRIPPAEANAWLLQMGIKRSHSSQTLESMLWAYLFDRPAEEQKVALKLYVRLYANHHCVIPDTSVKWLLRDQGLI